MQGQGSRKPGREDGVRRRDRGDWKLCGIHVREKGAYASLSSALINIPLPSLLPSYITFTPLTVSLLLASGHTFRSLLASYSSNSLLLSLVYNGR
jgi:hypothetical protein